MFFIINDKVFHWTFNFLLTNIILGKYSLGNHCKNKISINFHIKFKKTPGKNLSSVKSADMYTLKHFLIFGSFLSNSRTFFLFCFIYCLVFCLRKIGWGALVFRGIIMYTDNSLIKHLLILLTKNLKTRLSSKFKFRWNAKLVKECEVSKKRPFKSRWKRTSWNTSWRLKRSAKKSRRLSSSKVPRQPEKYWKKEFYRFRFSLQLIKLSIL